MGKLPFLKNGIAQIAILVKDLEKAVTNYYDKYGIGPWSFYTYSKPLLKTMSYKGEHAKYSMRIALANIGTLRIELIQPLEGKSIYHDFITEHGYGFHHLGLVVDDMSEAVKAAEAHNLHVSMDGSGFGLDGDGHFSYLDTENDLGVTLELIQRPKRRIPPEKTYPPEK